MGEGEHLGQHLAMAVVAQGGCCWQEGVAAAGGKGRIMVLDYCGCGFMAGEM